MSLEHYNIALDGVTEVRWLKSIMESTAPIRVNRDYTDYLITMRGYSDLTLGRNGRASFDEEFFRQMFPTTKEKSLEALSSKFVSLICTIYPIAARRTLGCAYGGRCRVGGCALCLSIPMSIVAEPVDFPSFCAVFWSYKPASNFSAGLGAMLAVSHVRGHSCIATLFANATGTTLPHGVDCLTDIKAIVNAETYSMFEEEFEKGVLKVVITSRGIGDSVHYLPCSRLSPGRLPELAVASANTSVVMTVLPSLPDALKDHVPDDRADGGGFIAPSEVCSKTCGGLQDGYGFCAACRVVVKLEDHVERCAKVSDPMVKLRARLGDAYHRFDVIIGLTASGVHGAEQTVAICDMVSAKEQHKYMVHSRRCRESCVHSVASTDFEANYSDFRADYLAFAFPSIHSSVFSYELPMRAALARALDPPKFTQVDDVGINSSFLAGLGGGASSSSNESATNAVVKFTGRSKAAIEAERAVLRNRKRELEFREEKTLESEGEINNIQYKLRVLGKEYRGY